MKEQIRGFFIISMTIFILAGCAHDQTGQRSAREIFDEAAELAKKEKVEQAAEKFMEVRTYYPGDVLAKEAVLATADLYYNAEQYESALQSYEEYRLLYPTDEKAAYCMFRIGLCHFNQISDNSIDEGKAIDRDQSKTVRAIQTFDNFLASYPNAPEDYRNSAKDNLLEAKTILAKHYIYIGKFYLKKKNFKAACGRFEYVKKQYPGLSLEDDIDDLISKSCTKDTSEPQK